MKNTTPETLLERTRETIRVDYFAFRDTCNILFPILKPHARVVNLTCRFGFLSMIPSQHIRDAFASPHLTEEKLSNLMKAFVRYVELRKVPLSSLVLTYLIIELAQINIGQLKMALTFKKDGVSVRTMLLRPV